MNVYKTAADRMREKIAAAEVALDEAQAALEEYVADVLAASTTESALPATPDAPPAETPAAVEVAQPTEPATEQAIAVPAEGQVTPESTPSEVVAEPEAQPGTAAAPDVAVAAAATPPAA